MRLISPTAPLVSVVPFLRGWRQLLTTIGELPTPGVTQITE
jgi:hypothetical protein